MYIVTGGAGFIGANMVHALNQRGITDILVVDHLTQADKFLNLTDLEIADYMEAERFLEAIEKDQFSGVEAVFHEGACSDTMATDGRYVMENNYAFSKTLLHWCQRHHIPLLYASSASVYGMTGSFSEERQAESPLNIYGFSKFQFDQYLRRMWHTLEAPVHGFRYFNVYGPREFHKGRMASVALHFYNQYRLDGHVHLFAGSAGYDNGEQRRDFIHVDDVASVNMHFLDHPRSGIYNVGTGQAQSFNDVAVTVINSMRRMADENIHDLASLQKAQTIRYISMPEALHGKYQSFTQADIRQLRAAGYNQPFLSVEQGVARYIHWLAGRES
ncbi:ADP-glyceromanno-heptose 6-epimerase [Acidithiobacillus montserratensis]|uniref:ADP-glyceromanno-heptose 6-epimerase n=1 Tax=Acidithiobacillus montserratensis TaxID=2729135 RepID=A0ACD5HBL7_9PROT|nr:ADP-glyceromanno-heptose 6-epimerase [Acidithiobacillus montserratensis]MBN2679606.1 ADP-glyceromanno-heptose 6-epimerase [Acidithiobacillaceae bacterium]MBU2747110.1 ADP-glyceromanno-heptose 6-epimerase [Acidithiobacillus montserratensis]